MLPRTSALFQQIPAPAIKRYSALKPLVDSWLVDKPARQALAEHQYITDALNQIGCWGYIDITNGVVHYYAKRSVSREQLLMFFAHELGHWADEQRQSLDEEQRADMYFWVAQKGLEAAEQHIRYK